MTTTPTAAAAHLLESLHDWQGQEGQTDASMLTVVLEAQVRATFALAAEQRTTNLVARWDALRNPPIGIRTTVDDWNELERLDREIRARLLPENVTP